MTVVRPPAVATWLLRRLGRRERLESLAGDLWEEHQQRRSSIWYWRQVVAAIALGACQDVRDHTWLAGRAVLTGYGFLYLYYGLLISPLMDPGYFWTLPPGIRGPMFIVLSGVVPMAAMGWLVGRLHRSHLAAAVLAVTVFVFLPLNFPELARKVANALDHSRYVPALAADVRLSIVALASLLLGGLRVSPPDHQSV
jgi:hypothetical protein